MVQLNCGERTCGIRGMPCDDGDHYKTLHMYDNRGLKHAIARAYKEQSLAVLGMLCSVTCTAVPVADVVPMYKAFYP